MASRTTQTMVRFSRAFLLPSFSDHQPAGEYQVDNDEESVEGASWLAWHRVATFIHLPGIGIRAATQQLVPIRSADLDALLEKDDKP